MAKLTIAICDDDKSICSQLEDYILEYARKASIEVRIDIFYDGGSLVRYMSEEHGNYDLIYLDIEMKEINGVEVGVKIRQELNDHKIQIVYISGTSNYDRQLFDVQPLLFIPKPIDKVKLNESIDLAIKKLALSPKLFHYKKRKEYFNILLEDIMYFENVGRNVKIVTVDDEDIFTGNVKDIAKELAAYGFIQVSQSVIINYLFISKYSRDEILLLNQEKVSIPKNKRTEVKERVLREIDKTKRNKELGGRVCLV